ncbi:hypothetical protein CYCD_21280 [Tenuifilaceae bacterium CYCD]|nr:hypothetical protein CYCD_21280 [Tenuifilaceae bacterium CYCD]
MGKGDKKTRRGKIFMGSYGNTRPQKATVKIEMPKVEPAKPRVTQRKKQ